MKTTLPSGAELDITLAPFGAGHKLFKAVLSEIESVKLNLGGSSFGDFLGREVDGEAIDTIKNLIVRLLSSEKVEEALWPCLERSTYRGHKVNKDLFEEEGIRADFIPICKEVLGFNLSPFFKNLASLLSVLKKKSTELPK